MVGQRIDPGNFSVSLWRLLNPPAASNVYRATFSAGGGCALILASYTTVDQTSPTSANVVTANGTSTNPNVGPVTDATLTTATIDGVADTPVIHLTW